VFDIVVSRVICNGVGIVVVNMVIVGYVAWILKKYQCAHFLYSRSSALWRIRAVATIFFWESEQHRLLFMDSVMMVEDDLDSLRRVHLF